MGRSWRAAVALSALLSVTCGREDAPRFQAAGELPRAKADHAVEIVEPPGLGVLDVATVDARGRPAGIPCATCHQAGSDPALAKREAHPKAMHRELPREHGELDCASCHDGDDPQRLVLASGERLAMAEYMRLCAQCHGPQARDYKHGSHGGMKGHWDLRSGPRVRNGCLACHAAHAPAYPQVLPAPAPNDRFLEPKHEPGAAYEQRWQEGEP